MQKKLDYIIHSHTLQGTRDQNNDRYFTYSEDGFTCACLCDGVGSLGGDAAHFAIQFLEKNLFQIKASDKIPSAELIRAMHEYVGGKASHSKTVIALIVITSGRAHLIHLGDVRIYHFRRGRYVSRTHDHTYAETMFLAGELKEEEIGGHVNSNHVFKYVGGSNEAFKPEYQSFPVDNDDVFLLSSDGYWSRTTIKMMEQLSTIPLNEIEELLKQELTLCEQRNIASGNSSDNITVIVIKASK